MASAFVDKARISIHAGKGGDAVAFHREKSLPPAALTGETAAAAGISSLLWDDNMSTLMDFRYKRKYTAGSGANGQGAATGQGRRDAVYKAFPAVR